MTQIDCGDLQDRMPDVAAEAAQWTPEEAAHLAACDSCAQEWQIVLAARRLGAPAAGAIDPAAMALKVMAGVRGEAKRRRWRRATWISGLAAAAVLVLVVRTTFPYGSPGSASDSLAIASGEAASNAIPVAELDALDADQLQAVLEHLDAAAGTTEGGGVPLMGDLDDQQLERVLRSLEG